MIDSGSFSTGSRDWRDQRDSIYTRFVSGDYTMNSKSLKLTWIILISLVVASCGPSNEDHIYEIGKKYTLTEFTLNFSNSRTFSFTQAELDALESAWHSTSVDFQTEIYIDQNGTPLRYQLQLSDGFEMAYEGDFLKLQGVHCLHLMFEGDGDVFSGVIQLDNVLDVDRLEELFLIAANAEKRNN